LKAMLNNFTSFALLLHTKVPQVHQIRIKKAHHTMC
jgi:hypothetical protein